MASRSALIWGAIIVVIIAVIAGILVAQHRGGAGTTTMQPSPSPTQATTTPTQTTTSTPTTHTSSPTKTATGAQTTTITKTTPPPATTKTTTTTTKCKKWITITVLTRHPADIQSTARKMFLSSSIAKQFCIKDVRFVALPAGFWPEVIKRRHIDVAWGGGPTLFDTLFLNGLLRPLQTKLALEAAAQIPDTIAGGMPLKRIKNGKIYWVAAAIASFGFTVNKDVAKKLGFDLSKLKTWKDLASDELGLILVKTGQPALAIANPLMSTSNTRMYEIILQAYGWEEGWKILTLMAANAKIEQGSAIVRDDVINGVVMVGITIDFYGYTAHRLNPACYYVMPEGQTIVNGDPIAVTISTKYPEAAEAFVAWVLTDGQKIWLSPNVNRLPANPKVFDTPEGKKRPDLKQAYYQALHAKAMKFNDTLALETEYPMQLYFVATLVDMHDLLQQAWVALLKAYYIDHKIDRATFEKLKDKLAEPVEFVDPMTHKKTKFTIQEAIKINEELKKNMSLKEAYMNAWRTAARQKYLEVLKALGQG